MSRSPGLLPSRPPSALMKALLKLASLHAVAEYLGLSFFLLFAWDRGWSMPGLVGLHVGMWAGALATLFLIPSLDRYTAFRWGLALKGGVYLALLTPWGAAGMLPLMLLMGFSLNLYWIPYNIVFMDELEDRERATWSSVLFLVVSVFGALMPAVAGFTIDLWGYAPAFLAGAAACAVAIAAVDLDVGRRWKDRRRRFPFRTVRRLRETGNIALPITLEGTWDGVIRTALPVMALLFVETAGDYGLVLAVFGLGGSVAALVTARWSDAKLERGGPIVAASALAAAGAAAMAFVTDGTVWTALSGLIFFAIFLIVPFNFTAARELSPDSMGSMIAREVYLNSGRLAGTTLLALILLLHGPDDPGAGTFAPALLIAAAAIVTSGLVFRSRLMGLKNGRIAAMEGVGEGPPPGPV